jgi:hypothetical protein
MRLSQLARRPRHHVGAVPEPGRQSPGILDRKPHSITPGAASPTPAGRTVTRWQPTTSRRPVFPCSRSMVVAALHVVEAESNGGCAPSVRGGRTSRPVRGRRGFRGLSADARPPMRGSKLSAFLRTPAPSRPRLRTSGSRSEGTAACREVDVTDCAPGMAKAAATGRPVRVPQAVQPKPVRKGPHLCFFRLVAHRAAVRPCGRATVRPRTRRDPFNRADEWGRGGGGYLGGAAGSAERAGDGCGRWHRCGGSFAIGGCWF